MTDIIYYAIKRFLVGISWKFNEGLFATQYLLSDLLDYFKLLR